jgi:hypothetical protein
MHDMIYNKSLETIDDIYENTTTKLPFAVSRANLIHRNNEQHDKNQIL